MAAHIDDETLERYAMKQLPETEAAPVEEHLLVCHHCQDRLAEIDRLLAALRMSW
jgi:anti-sigma factor ChrR (cupin superfamily)